MALKQEKSELTFETIEPMCACIEDDCEICMKSYELLDNWLDKHELTEDGFVLKVKEKNDPDRN